MTHKKPNVLMICTDHFAAEHLGVDGDDDVRTPGFNELALTGVRFTNVYSVGTRLRQDDADSRNKEVVC